MISPEEHRKRRFIAGLCWRHSNVRGHVAEGCIWCSIALHVDDPATHAAQISTAVLAYRDFIPKNTPGQIACERAFADLINANVGVSAFGEMLKALASDLAQLQT